MRHFILSASLVAIAACGAQSTDTAVAQEAETTVETPTVEYGKTGTYALDLTHAALVWQVSHWGLSDYTGRFTNFDATLEFDPEDPSATSISVTIDPMSVSTEYEGDYLAGHGDSGFQTWDEDMARNARWFNADEFPQITFTSTEITPTGDATGTVTGDLTFLGVTKPVTLDVTYNGVAQFPWSPDTDKIGFSASTTIKRSDFGMTALLPNIGDDVSIEIEAEFGEAAE